MNRPVLNEQQTRILGMLAGIMPDASMEEKKYILGRMEGYAQARAEIAAARKQKEEEKEVG